MISKNLNRVPNAQPFRMVKKLRGEQGNKLLKDSFISPYIWFDYSFLGSTRERRLFCRGSFFVP